MKPFLPILAIICTLFCSHSIVFGQDTEGTMEFDEKKELRKRFSHNVLKLDLLSSLHGDLAFSYEQRFTPRFSIEGGMGVIMFRYVPSFIDWVWLNDKTLSDNNFQGFSFRVQARLYLFKFAADRTYVGLAYRQRNYLRKSEKSIISRDYYFSFGYHMLLSSRLTLDFSTGFGSRRWNNGGYHINSLFIPIGIQLGIRI